MARADESFRKRPIQKARNHWNFSKACHDTNAILNGKKSNKEAV